MEEEEAEINFITHEGLLPSDFRLLFHFTSFIVSITKSGQIFALGKYKFHELPMKFLRLLPALLLLVASTAKAQFDSSWNVTINDSSRKIIVSNFASVSEARSVINEIISVMNLKVNFEVREANVPNAGAVVYNNKRFILYNPSFIKQIDRAAKTDWASISILAHEIGHHVLGHTFKSGGNLYQQELDADQFSGMALKKMGATLEESQAAMILVASDRASATHPARISRLDAIAKGWYKVAAPENSDVASAKATQPITTTSVSERSSVSVASEKRNSRESVISDRNILVDVKFSIDKNNEYFITVQNNVVRWDGNNLDVVGKLGKLKNPDYPYYIYDASKTYYLISNEGYMLTQSGNKVGYLTMHTASATAGR